MVAREYVLFSWGPYSLGNSEEQVENIYYKNAQAELLV